MSETADISEMAEVVFETVFSHFGWAMSDGPRNFGWSCVSKRQHQLKSKKHPTDVVFHYSDPYFSQRRYFNVDLKSYAKSSMKGGKIKDALVSLKKTVECAPVSEHFVNRYVTESDSNFRVDGLLFVYNHDGEYHRDFSRLISGMQGNLAPKNERRIYIFDPHRIVQLITVADKLEAFFKDRGSAGSSGFLHPSYTNHKTEVLRSSSATVESLLGDWLIAYKFHVVKSKIVQSYALFYFASGGSVEEFRYLISYIFRINIVAPDAIIKVIPVNPGKSTRSNFQTALKRLIEENSGKGITDRLESVIIYERAPLKTIMFSEEEIGMEPRSRFREEEL